MSSRLLIGRRVSSSLLFLTVLLVLFVLHSVHGTEIKWTAGNTGTKNDPAATAPRSQKYWDEHGIKRPDYAKTDAELAAERRQNGNAGANGTTSRSSSLAITVLKWMALFVAAGMGVVGYQQHHRIGGGGGGGGGARLDGSISSFVFKRHQLTAEEARNARLARFDASIQAD